MKLLNGCPMRASACSSVIEFSISGCTPPSQASSNTGCMTKKVMNSAMEVSTMLGGVWLSPSADRSIEKTITKRVKLVMMTSSPGASDSTVIAAMS